MRRLLGIGFGLFTQALFLATLVPLYFFLRNDFSAAPEGSLWIDAGLALCFAVPHSILLYPGTRKFVTQWLPSELYGCLFCLVTCGSLLAQIALWRGSETVVWAWPASLQPAVHWAFVGCWGLLVYALSLTGLQYQTGIGPWWRWVRGQTLPRRQFTPRGLYRLIRHPAYLAFLGLVWFTPVLTADRVVLMAVWTGYVFVGSYLKDRRLAGVLGEPYLAYVDAVPAYPLLTWQLKPSPAPVYASGRPARQLQTASSPAKGP
jgi:protein-S-isoprenylcysteine O-methyltransferase Ste14